MAGYWPFLCVCLWTEMELRSINMQKKEQCQYLSQRPNMLGQ